MRVFVKNGGTSYVIPCKDPKASVAALKREALARCFAGKHRDEESRYNLVLVSNGAVLCEEDAIQDVLTDGEFVSLRKLLILIYLHYRFGLFHWYAKTSIRARFILHETVE